MSNNTHCGEHATWEYGQTPDGEKQCTDPVLHEITDLKSQIMSLQIQIQTNELNALVEKIARDENPTIKDAWEQYQAVLKLVKK